MMRKRTAKALVACTLWSVLLAAPMIYFDVGSMHSDPLMAVVGATTVCIWLIGFKWIFIKVAQDDPWTWLKE